MQLLWICELDWLDWDQNYSCKKYIIMAAAEICPPGLPWGGKYYSVVDGVCTRDSSFFGGKPLLGQGVGYAVVLGFGAFFAFFTSFLVQYTPQ
jgi:hypothetical protein